jgi:hypothetical protein
VELFAGLVLNGVGVVLQSINVLAQAGILVFKLLDLVLELLFLAALAVPSGQTMTAVEHTPGEGKGESDGEDRAGRAPSLLKPLDGPFTRRKRLIGRFLFFTEQIWVLHSASV